MKIQHCVMTMVAMVLLAMLTISGTLLSEQYPQAAQAHSVGFDALAHSLFDGALANNGQTGAR